MEEIKGYVELIIAATYSAHTVIAFCETGESERRNGDGQQFVRQPDQALANSGRTKHHRLRPSPETLCLLAVALSYYTLGGISVFAGH